MKDQLSQKILSIIADKIQSHPEVQDAPCMCVRAKDVEVSESVG